MPETVLVAFCTCPGGEPAAALAAALVEHGLAACVNVLPEIRSTYRWQGRIETDAEALLLIKTTGGRLAALKAWVAANHPYDVPELLAVRAADGLGPYLDWVVASVAEES